MTTFLAALAILGASLLFIGGVLLLLGGAWLLARALAEVQRTRVHRISADAQEEVLGASQEALGDIHDQRERQSGQDYGPTDAELIEAIHAEREIRTAENEIRDEPDDEQPLIPPDRQYVVP